MTSAPTHADERERLEAAALAFAVHFSDPVLLHPDAFTVEDLRLVVAFHAAAYAVDLQLGADVPY